LTYVKNLSLPLAMSENTIELITQHLPKMVLSEWGC